MIIVNMSETKRTFLQVVIDPEKKEKFVEKVKQEGKNITDVIMDFVDSYIDDSEQIDITDVSERLKKLEDYIYSERETILGEIAAWEKKTSLSGNSKNNSENSSPQKNPHRLTRVDFSITDNCIDRVMLKSIKLDI